MCVCVCVGGGGLIEKIFYSKIYYSKIIFFHFPGKYFLQLFGGGGGGVKEA